MQQVGGQGHDLRAQAAQFNRDHIRTPETKEFFKSSEFLVLVLGIVALLVASAAAPEFDAGRVWTLLTILGVGYMVSRGFSKAGSRSDDDARGVGAVAHPSQGYAGSGTGSGPDAGAFIDQHVRTPETKEFFKTSEFGVWVLGIVGILLAAAVAADVLDAIRAWTLITALSSGYIISRGLSKAGTHRADDWPSEAGLHQGNDAQAAMARAAHFVRTPETKEFFKTSEFLVWALTVAALLIASAIVDIFDAQHAWERITAVSVAYILSRGLAKIGTRTDIRDRARLGRGRQNSGGFPIGAGPVPQGVGVEPYGTEMGGRISQKQGAPTDTFPAGAGPQPGGPQPPATPL
jgi:hypothetical protein